MRNERYLSKSTLFSKHFFNTFPVLMLFEKIKAYFTFSIVLQKYNFIHNKYLNQLQKQ